MPASTRSRPPTISATRSGFPRRFSELKIDVGPGYRLCYTMRGAVVVILLCGGDKSSQKRDIKRVEKIASTLED